MKMNLDHILAIALDAGKAVMEVYNNSTVSVEFKQDQSPLTLADRLSNEIISDRLVKMDSSIPVLSEESEGVPYERRKEWERFWLVDPLDGTKEFIKRNGEFTVNIALVHDGSPVLGVIYAPVKSTLYYASRGDGAFRVDSSGTKTKLRVTERKPGGDLVVVSSRSHKTEALARFMAQLDTCCEGVSEVSVGSSLKFCLVAEGRAHIYPRLGPTMEWDTSAGQMIVEEAGGRVMDIKTMSALRYNKESLLNNHFIASDGCFSLERPACHSEHQAKNPMASTLNPLNNR